MDRRHGHTVFQTRLILHTAFLLSWGLGDLVVAASRRNLSNFFFRNSNDCLKQAAASSFQWLSFRCFFHPVCHKAHAKFIFTVVKESFFPQSRPLQGRGMVADHIAQVLLRRVDMDPQYFLNIKRCLLALSFCTNKDL